MKIRVLGAGFYGCHLSAAFLKAGHEVELHEIADRIFAGASGAIPARLHCGAHYPRSRLTRAMCQEHHTAFMAQYGHLTSSVPVNIYAVAAHDSLVDFENYRQVLKGEIEFVTVEKPEEFGLQNVEGAILTGERHVIIDRARKHFQDALGDSLKLNTPFTDVDNPSWDFTFDATFCANGNAGVDRYEPCVTALLEGPADKAITIMDGPFPSIYPWNEQQCLSSLTSAKLTPLAKCGTYAEASSVLRDTPAAYIEARAGEMLEQMAYFWPEAKDRYRVAECKLSIRAMPRSGADARLVDIVRVGDRALRVRAGKIDAILHAEQMIKEMIA